MSWTDEIKVRTQELKDTWTIFVISSLAIWKIIEIINWVIEHISITFKF